MNIFFRDFKSKYITNLFKIFSTYSALVIIFSCSDKTLNKTKIGNELGIPLSKGKKNINNIEEDHKKIVKKFDDLLKTLGSSIDKWVNKEDVVVDGNVVFIKKNINFVNTDDPNCMAKKAIDYCTSRSWEELNQLIARDWCKYNENLLDVICNKDFHDYFAASNNDVKDNIRKALSSWFEDRSYSLAELRVAYNGKLTKIGITILNFFFDYCTILRKYYGYEFIGLNIDKDLDKLEGSSGWYENSYSPKIMENFEDNITEEMDIFDNTSEDSEVECCI